LAYTSATEPRASASGLNSRPDGTIGHAEVKIADSVIMMGEASEQWKPMPAGPAGLYTYVGDSDAVYKRALEAGATSIMEPTDRFYGDCNAAVKDPSGNIWFIATHKADVMREEMAKRAQAATARFPPLS
jgi:PhnB protein